MLQIQAHNSSGVIHLCHTSCVRQPVHSARHYTETWKLVAHIGRGDTQQLSFLWCVLSFYFCNTSNTPNSTPQVKTWLDANPNEVIVILIVNSDNLPPPQYATVYQSVGLDTISYSPTAATIDGSQWPTLGSLIVGFPMSSLHHAHIDPWWNSLGFWETSTYIHGS